MLSPWNNAACRMQPVIRLPCAGREGCGGVAKPFFQGGLRVSELDSKNKQEQQKA